MADAATDFLKAYPKKVTTRVEKPEPVADDPASQFLKAYPKAGAAPAPATSPQPQPPGTKRSSSGFMTTSVMKLAGGSSFSEVYENSSFRKVMEGIIPEHGEHDD